MASRWERQWKCDAKQCQISGPRGTHVQLGSRSETVKFFITWNKRVKIKTRACMQDYFIFMHTKWLNSPKLSSEGTLFRPEVESSPAICPPQCGWETLSFAVVCERASSWEPSADDWSRCTKKYIEKLHDAIPQHASERTTKCNAKEAEIEQSRQVLTGKNAQKCTFSFRLYLLLKLF